jgi:hypothetical protein
VALSCCRLQTAVHPQLVLPVAAQWPVLLQSPAEQQMSSSLVLLLLLPVAAAWDP